MTLSVTATVKKDGHYWDEENKCYWNTEFVVGDIVSYKGGGGSYGGNLQDVFRNREYVVEGISVGTTIDSLTTEVYGSLAYFPVYTQRLHLRGVPKAYSAKHFTLVRNGINMPTLQLDVDRPCLVFELEVDADGKKSVKDPKKGKPFDSMSLAKAWVEEQIVTSIRENNVYPQYSVYEERFIGRAEKPPVVFE